LEHYGREFYKFSRLISYKGQIANRRKPFIYYSYPFPKVENSRSLEEYKHISLVGCVYMVVSKILARRMKVVLSKLIYQNHSTFVGKG